MAAYAALLSLMNLLEQLQRHPQPPITLDTNQVETLTQNIAFLQHFLEVYNSHYSKPEMERLRNHIADGAHAVENFIETHIVNWNRARSFLGNLGPPIALDTNQVHNLTQKIAFLKDFLEVYNSNYSKPEMERLRNRIANVVYAAENVIQTHRHRVRRILTRFKIYNEEERTYLRDLFLEVEELLRQTASTISDEENICSIDLHEVIRDMGFVEKEVLDIKDTLGTQDPQRFITTDVVAPKSTSTEHNIMVGFDDVLIEMLDKLTGQLDSRRQIILISGMGGIGKTTLARNVYINPLTKYHFDIRVWITISQEYNVRDILLGVVLSQKNQGSWESMSGMSEAEIGEMLYKSLCGRRYLIMMDDMWSHEAWNGVNSSFQTSAMEVE